MVNTQRHRKRTTLAQYLLESGEVVTVRMTRARLSEGNLHVQCESESRLRVGPAEIVLRTDLGMVRLRGSALRTQGAEYSMRVRELEVDPRTDWSRVPSLRVTVRREGGAVLPARLVRATPDALWVDGVCDAYEGERLSVAYEGGGRPLLAPLEVGGVYRAQVLAHVRSLSPLVARDVDDLISALGERVAELMCRSPVA